MAVPKIMIAARDSIMAMDVEESLAEMGCSVAAVVSSSLEATRMAAKVLPDLVLLDVDVQPADDGADGELKFFEALNAPIVVITNRPRHKAEVVVPFCRFCGWIQKPFADRELKAAVEAALQRSHRRVATRWEACCVRARS